MEQRFEASRLKVFLILLGILTVLISSESFNIGNYSNVCILRDAPLRQSPDAKCHSNNSEFLIGRSVQEDFVQELIKNHRHQILNKKSAAPRFQSDGDIGLIVNASGIIKSVECL